MKKEETYKQAQDLAINNGYCSNKSVVFKCSYHVVFCPKYRRDVLVDGVDERLKEIIEDLSSEIGFHILSMEIRPDHVHLLLDVDPQFGIHKVVKRIKGRSSKILRDEFPHLKSRIPTLWTNSYFCTTTGGSSLDVVKQYVEMQKSV